jgi:hypothetical protein
VRHTSARQLVGVWFGLDDHRDVLHATSELIGNEIVGDRHQAPKLFESHAFPFYAVSMFPLRWIGRRCSRRVVRRFRYLCRISGSDLGRVIDIEAPCTLPQVQTRRSRQLKRAINERNQRK